MHGIIFTALKKFVKARLGPEAWDALRTEAGLDGRIYLPVQPYPDEEIQALVSTASRLTGIPASDLLEDYGAFIVPDLMTIYRGVLNPAWRTLDLIDHVENTIHRVVRLSSPGATPPELSVVRLAPERLVIHYDSPRRLCSVGKGLVRGIAAFYGETVAIQETSCMLKGHSACTILVTLTPASIPVV